MKPQTPKKGAPPRYDETLKEGAVKLVTEAGRSTADVARELGVSTDSLRAWLRVAGVAPAQADRSNVHRQEGRTHRRCGFAKQSAEKMLSVSGN